MVVLNKYHYGNKIPSGAINIMRGTIYGNPFVIGKDGSRDEVIQKYRKWLWIRIKEDYDFSEKIKDLYGRDLCCCCYPLPCHGDILLKAAEYLNKVKD